MSQVIKDTLAVLKGIRDLYSGERGAAAIRELRIRATSPIVARRGVVRGTIEESLRRGIGVKSVPGQFDPLVDQWLQGDPAGLRSVLMRRASDQDDKHLLAEFFEEVAGDPLDSQRDGRPAKPTRTRSKQVPRKTRPVAVVLDEDVAQIFRTDKAVNDALRRLIKLARTAVK